MFSSTGPRFSGKDPKAWISVVERTLFNCQIHPAHHVQFALELLDGEALTWARPRELLFLNRGWNDFIYRILCEFDKPYREELDVFSCAREHNVYDEYKPVSFVDTRVIRNGGVMLVPGEGEIFELRPNANASSNNNVSLFQYPNPNELSELVLAKPLESLQMGEFVPECHRSDIVLLGSASTQPVNGCAALSEFVGDIVAANSISVTQLSDIEGRLHEQELRLPVLQNQLDGVQTDLQQLNLKVDGLQTQFAKMSRQLQLLIDTQDPSRVVSPCSNENTSSFPSSPMHQDISASPRVHTSLATQMPITKAHETIVDTEGAEVDDDSIKDVLTVTETAIGLTTSGGIKEAVESSSMGDKILKGIDTLTATENLFGIDNKSCIFVNHPIKILLAFKGGTYRTVSRVCSRCTRLVQGIPFKVQQSHREMVKASTHWLLLYGPAGTIGAVSSTNCRVSTTATCLCGDIVRQGLSGLVFEPGGQSANTSIQLSSIVRLFLWRSWVMLLFVLKTPVDTHLKYKVIDTPGRNGAVEAESILIQVPHCQGKYHMAATNDVNLCPITDALVTIKPGSFSAKRPHKSTHSLSVFLGEPMMFENMYCRIHIDSHDTRVGSRNIVHVGIRPVWYNIFHSKAIHSSCLVSSYSGQINGTSAFFTLGPNCRGYASEVLLNFKLTDYAERGGIHDIIPATAEDNAAMFSKLTKVGYFSSLFADLDQISLGKSGAFPVFVKVMMCFDPGILYISRRQLRKQTCLKDDIWGLFSKSTSKDLSKLGDPAHYTCLISKRYNYQSTPRGPSFTRNKVLFGAHHLAVTVGLEKSVATLISVVIIFHILMFPKVCEGAIVLMSLLVPCLLQPFSIIGQRKKSLMAGQVNDLVVSQHSYILWPLEMIIWQIGYWVSATLMDFVLPRALKFLSYAMGVARMTSYKFRLSCTEFRYDMVWQLNSKQVGCSIIVWMDFRLHFPVVVAFIGHRFSMEKHASCVSVLSPTAAPESSKAMQLDCIDKVLCLTSNPSMFLISTTVLPYTRVWMIAWIIESFQYGRKLIFTIAGRQHDIQLVAVLQGLMIFSSPIYYSDFIGPLSNIRSCVFAASALRFCFHTTTGTHMNFKQVGKSRNGARYIVCFDTGISVGPMLLVVDGTLMFQLWHIAWSPNRMGGSGDKALKFLASNIAGICVTQELLQAAASQKIIGVVVLWVVAGLSCAVQLQWQFGDKVTIVDTSVNRIITKYLVIYDNAFDLRDTTQKTRTPHADVVAGDQARSRTRTACQIATLVFMWFVSCWILQTGIQA